MDSGSLDALQDDELLVRDERQEPMLETDDLFTRRCTLIDPMLDCVVQEDAPTQR